MAQYQPPKTEAEFKENFIQKKPLMNETEAFYESSRCLFCYDAPCMNACPTHIDVPLFIKQIHTGNVIGAAETIFEANWLGNACGVVCPTTELCEGSCVYDKQNVPVIQIGRLQNFATSKAMKQDAKLFSPAEPNGKKVAVVGAGPAGLSCACELRTLGYNVDIYEAKSKPSGLTVYGIAPYKISNEEVLDEIDYLQKQLGFNIHYNQAIKTKDQLEELENNYAAIFLGVGIGPTRDLGLDGEDKEGVIGAVEFIEELRMKHHEIQVPEKVVVIGGGNTAMDAASESAKMGAKQVSLVYRRDRESMGAYDFEYDFTVSTGVDPVFNATPIEIIGNGQTTGVKFIKTEVVDGKLTNIEGSEFIIECGLVIKATGQAKQGHFLSLINGLELDEKNRISVNPETYQTTNPIYFAGGDAVNGGAEVVNGAYEGKMAAQGIHLMLNLRTEK
jgi:glutamate synthase (NADPH/NADH) small chain